MNEAEIRMETQSGLKFRDFVEQGLSRKRPSRKVTERIETGLKKYADELRNISFA